MFAFFFDKTLYKVFKNRWKLEDEYKALEYTIPKTTKVEFNDGNPEEIVIFKYPSHYRHMEVGQYNYAFAFYFGFLALASGYTGLRFFIKKRSYKTLIAMSIISFVSIQEAIIGFTRVKDVKSIIVKNGRRV